MDQQTVSWVFSGAGVTAILLILSAIKLLFIFIPFPLFNITKEEKTLLNNNIRLLRFLIVEIIIFPLIFIYGLAVGDISYPNKQLVNAFPFFGEPSTYPERHIFAVSIFVIILVCILLIRHSALIRNVFFKFLQKSKVLQRNSENKKVELISLFIFVLSFLIIFYFYLFITLYYFGYSINLILYDIGLTYQMNVKASSAVLMNLWTSNVKSITIYALIFIYIVFHVVYRWLINQLFLVSILISYSEILATITLTNGEILTDKYILRPSIDGNLFIGDKPSIDKSTEKIILPKQNIIYIKFKQVPYLFGKELKKSDEKESQEGSLPPRRLRK